MYLDESGTPPCFHPEKFPFSPFSVFLSCENLLAPQNIQPYIHQRYRIYSIYLFVFIRLRSISLYNLGKSRSFFYKNTCLTHIYKRTNACKILRNCSCKLQLRYKMDFFFIKYLAKGICSYKHALIFNTKYFDNYM